MRTNIKDRNDLRFLENVPGTPYKLYKSIHGDWYYVVNHTNTIEVRYNCGNIALCFSSRKEALNQALVWTDAEFSAHQPRHTDFNSKDEHIAALNDYADARKTLHNWGRKLGLPSAIRYSA